MKENKIPIGPSVALLSAVLFGVSTPVSKVLLLNVPPLLLAGFLYLGSGAGLLILRLFLRRGSVTEAPLTKNDMPWLAAAILAGGVVAPVLLMVGLRTTAASSASLLLNLESVFTALMAWFIFGENFSRRVVAGMILIVIAGLLLSLQSEIQLSLSTSSLAIIGACVCWGIDNNLTQKVSGSDPVQIAAIKGLAAGTVNLMAAIALGESMKGPQYVLVSGLVGFVGYGLSLVLYVHALRSVGAARTSAYFSLAPFVGATVSVIFLSESFNYLFYISGIMMAAGVWFHITERHEHEHSHEPVEHAHRHVHDEHHEHDHLAETDPREPHTHLHEHQAIMHSHSHHPDTHHRHPH